MNKDTAGRTWTFPLTGPINLQVRAGHGSVTVQAEDGLAEARVDIVPRREDSQILQRATVDMHGRTLQVITPRQGGLFEMIADRWRGTNAADLTITVPSGTAMKISSFTSTVSVTGRAGTADIAAGAADITVDEVDGDLRLRYGSGKAAVRRVTQSVELRSGSGDAIIGEVGGSLRCGCGSGRLKVETVRGPARFRAGSGEAHLGAVYGDVDVATGSGGLTVGLPAGQPARLDVTTGSGRVDSELPVVSVPATFGDADPITVRARTGSGNVRLFRAAAG